MDEVRRIILYGSLLVLGVSLLIMPLSIPTIRTNADFSVFNTDWNGASSFGSELRETGDVNPLIYSFNNNTFSSESEGEGEGVLIVMGSNQGYSSDEVQLVKDFVESGGVLFLADDFGVGEDLSGLVNASFSDSMVMDISFRKKPEFGSVVTFKPNNITENINRLVLNYPSALQGISNENSLASTSPGSWLDTNGNRERDVGEPNKSYKILGKKELGNGTVILLSDPSILINGMLDKADNEKFMENLTKYLENRSGSNTFYVDEAHRDSVNPYELATVTIERNITPLGALLLVLGFGGAVVILESKLFTKLLQRSVNYLVGVLDWFDELLGEDEGSASVVEEVLDENPEMDPKTIKEIVKEIETGSKLSRNHKKEEDKED